MSPSKVEFWNGVWFLGKLLKQSNVWVVKIVRFGVEWLEFWSEVKVERDQCVKICQWLNMVFCRQVCVEARWPRLSCAECELWSFIKQVG